MGNITKNWQEYSKYNMTYANNIIKGGKTVMKTIDLISEWLNTQIVNFEAIEEKEQYYILISFKKIKYIYDLQYLKLSKHDRVIQSGKIYKKKLTIKDLQTVYNDIDILAIIKQHSIKFRVEELGEICFSKKVDDCNKLVDILNGIRIIKSMEE